MRTCSILFVSFAVCLPFVQGVVTENTPYIGDCDLDKITEDGPIVLIVENGNRAPTLFGNYSQFLSESFICKTGRYQMKFRKFSPNDRALRYGLHSLSLPFNEINADELRLLALPQNLNKLIVPNNNIESISCGKYSAHLTGPFQFFIKESKNAKFAIGEIDYYPAKESRNRECIVIMILMKKKTCN